MRLKQLYKTYSLDELVEKYKKTHDELIFSVIYARIVGLIIKMLQHIEQDKDEIDDFIMYFNQGIINVIEKFDANKSKFMTYIIDTIRCDYINYVKYKTRQKRKPIAVLNIEDYENELYYYEDFCTNDNIAELADVLSKLTDRQREYIYLKYYVGLSSKEIADMFDVTVFHVNNYLAQIRKKIRDMVGADKNVVNRRNTNT